FREVPPEIPADVAGRRDRHPIVLLEIRAGNRRVGDAVAISIDRADLAKPEGRIRKQLPKLIESGWPITARIAAIALVIAGEHVIEAGKHASGHVRLGPVDHVVRSAGVTTAVERELRAAARSLDEIVGPRHFRDDIGGYTQPVAIDLVADFPD